MIFSPIASSFCIQRHLVEDNYVSGPDLPIGFTGCSLQANNLDGLRQGFLIGGPRAKSGPL